MMKVNCDCGHGSETAGKRSPSGYREHWSNVQCGIYFTRELDRHGIPYCKTGWDDANAYDDPDYSLSSRQRTVRANGCDVSISFHFNACGDGKTYNSAQGTEVLYSNKSPADSKRLADDIYKYLKGGTPQKGRGVKTQSLAMCNCAVMGTNAAVLIEAAFMTNEYEESLMKSDAYCKEVAQETMKGLCDYYKIAYIPEGETASYVTAKTYTVVKGDTLTKIAKQYGISSYKKLMEMNGLTSTVIKVGQVLKVN